MVRPRSCRFIYYFDTPALGRRHQYFGRVTHKQENVQATNLFIGDQPIKINNNFIPNRIHLTTESTTNLPSPKDLSSENPKPKTKVDPKNVACYKCNQKGHTSCFCKVNTKLHELQIDEDTINQLQNLYIEATNTNHSSSNTSEEEFQIDEIAPTSAASYTSINSKQINILT